MTWRARSTAVELIFGRRAASTGKLFGSVTTQEIADELDRVTSVDINRRRISQQSLREVGTHQVAVRLGNELSPTLDDHHRAGRRIAGIPGGARTRRSGQRGGHHGGRLPLCRSG